MAHFLNKANHEFTCQIEYEPETQEVGCTVILVSQKDSRRK